MMPRAYDNAILALDTTENPLRKACDRVESQLSGQQIDQTDHVLNVEGHGGERQHTTPASSPNDDLRQQFSGRRDRPPAVQRRRFLSTMCSHCKFWEREIGMSEADAQVRGRCEHGVLDDIKDEEPAPADDDQVSQPGDLAEDKITETGELIREVGPVHPGPEEEAEAHTRRASRRQQPTVQGFRLMYSTWRGAWRSFKRSRGR